MLKISKFMMIAVALVAVLLVAGCDQNIPEDGKAGDAKDAGAVRRVEKDKVQKEAESDQQIKVYFANEDGTKLIVKSKQAPKQDKYGAAVHALIAGTDESGLVSMIPKGTKLRGIKVEQGVAYVDFSQELVKKFNGGSTGELMLVGSIVNTLTEFPEIKAVQILIEGKVEETISGHMDISEPLKRMKNI